MREFFEDYGEFIVLVLIFAPAITMFIEIGIKIGQLNFGG